LLELLVFGVLDGLLVEEILLELAVCLGLFGEESFEVASD
jgi:hypothetical protein